MATVTRHSELLLTYICVLITMKIIQRDRVMFPGCVFIINNTGSFVRMNTYLQYTARVHIIYVKNQISYITWLTTMHRILTYNLGALSNVFPVVTSLWLIVAILWSTLALKHGHTYRTNYLLGRRTYVIMYRRYFFNLWLIFLHLIH